MLAQRQFLCDASSLLNDHAHGYQNMQSATQELEAMKKKLKEMEEEAARLKALQVSNLLLNDLIISRPAIVITVIIFNNGFIQAGGAPADGAGTSGTPEPGSKEEADARSIYVGNVDYSCTPEELQQHFQVWSMA